MIEGKCRVYNAIQIHRNLVTIIIYMPACVGEMGAPSGPTEAGLAGSPMVAADHMSSKMEGQGQSHQDHSRDLLLCVDLHSSSLGPSGHSTFPHGCSMVDKEGEAGSGQKEAEEVHKSESLSVACCMKSHMLHKSRAGNFKGWARSAEDNLHMTHHC